MRPIIVALGDSLTLGEHADVGLDLHNHPWPALLDANLYPEAGVANYGKGGNTVQEMHVRYTDWVKDLPNVDVVILWGPINNVVQDQSAATIQAALASLIDEIVEEDGRTCILVGTCGFVGYSDWTAPRQAVLDAVLAWMAARTDVTYVSAYAPVPAGLDDSSIPAAISLPLAVSDKLHINPTGTLQAADVMLLPYLRAIYPVPTPTPEPTALSSFGVTAAIVQTDYFSQGGGFSDVSNPSSTSVARYIQQKAGELGGLLRAEEQSPTALDADDTTEAYQWCQETLCLMVAVRVAEDMHQSRPPLADTWEKRLAARLEALADDAVGTLGDGSTTPTEQPDGPTHFIDTYGLDTSDNEADASSVTARLRRDDLL